MADCFNGVDWQKENRHAPPTSEIISDDRVETGIPALDADWLGKWIQPQHLRSSALETYRHTYHGGVMSILRIREFLLPDYARMLHMFMASEAIYETAYGLYHSGRASQEAWMAAGDDERMYRYDRLKDRRPDVINPHPLLYVKLRSDLADPRFIAFFQYLSGLDLQALDEIDGNAYGVGDYLRPHRDDVFNRRLAFILYLVPTWQPNYGGALHLVGQHDEKVTLTCEHNSLVVFDVHGHRFHYVGDIHLAAGEQRRLTIGGWYT